jgi:hypothetical protein
LFSLAPTVRQFLAVPGDPMESSSITPLPSVSTPSFPAENRMSMSGCSHMNRSTAREFWVYTPFAGAPQELVWIRAPAR